MTLRYCLTSSPETVKDYFACESTIEFPPRLDIAPTQPVLLVRINERGARELMLARWGLVPAWVKDPRDFKALFNARAETAIELPSFRAAMTYRRCIIPADGFYAWSKDSRQKTRYLICARSRSLLGFAALYERWMGTDGSEFDSIALLTTASGRVIRHICERMPVILSHALIQDWLDARSVSARDAARMLTPTDDLLEPIEASTAFSKIGQVAGGKPVD
jgi:putative SOS response-associated peptidase YedK